MNIQQLTMKKIEALDEKYPNAIPIFGGAYFAVKYVQGETIDLEKFLNYLVNIPGNAKFWEWENGIEDALNTFCHLCMIDPMLIELYLGVRFSEIAKHY